MYNFVHAHEYVMSDFLYYKRLISDIDCFFLTATQDAQMECEVSFYRTVIPLCILIILQLSLVKIH
jgi:hypothetical protein